MENSGDRNKLGRENIASIGAGIVITGDVECAAELQIGGRVHGDVRCHTLFLEEGGAVLGGVRAERMRISGIVEGTIDALDLAIEATGKVAGPVTYTRLKITPGGLVEGSFTHRAADVASHTPDGGGNNLKLVETPDLSQQPRRVYGE